MPNVSVRISGSAEGAIKAFGETAAASDASAEVIKKSSNKMGSAVSSSTSTSGFSLNTFGNKLMGMVPLWGKVGIAAAIVVAGVVTGAIVLAARYQDATNKMAAQAGITVAAAKKIGDAFLTTGGQTTFSAQQMMEAFGPVSGQLGLLAGHALTASESLGFMRAASALAEATGQSLNSTTAALAATMQAYGIPVKNAATVTDLLFNTSRSLNIPIASLSDTVDKLHTKLGPLAPSLGDVSSLLIDLASHGVTGSRGLLAVSTGMSTLLGGSKATKAEIADLGLHLFDANGKFVGMASTIAQLSPKLAGMTEAQRLLAEKTLFGSTAGRELDATLMAGTAAYNTAAAAATKHGTATAAADKASSGLSGSMDKVKASLADAGVTLGQYFQPILQTVVGWLAVAANWFASVLPGALKVLGVAFGIIGKVIGTEIGIAIAIIQRVIIIIQTITGVVTTVFGGIKGIISGVVGGITSVVQGIITTINRLWDGVSTNVANVWNGIVTFITGIPGAIAQAVKSVINGVIGVINFFIGAIDGAISGINDALGVIPTFGLGKIQIPQIPKIPVLDTGAIVTKPTLALLAMNSRPEAVVPLGSSGGVGGAPVGATTVNIYVSGGDPNHVVNALKQYMRTNGNVPINVRQAQRVGG